MYLFPVSLPNTNTSSLFKQKQFLLKISTHHNYGFSSTKVDNLSKVVRRELSTLLTIFNKSHETGWRRSLNREFNTSCTKPSISKKKMLVGFFTRIDKPNKNFAKNFTKFLKLVPAIFYQIFIFHQMIAFQKLWKMFFISSKKLFLFSS